MRPFPKPGKGLRDATLDEVAECLPVSRETSAALWALIPPDGPPQGEWPEPDSPDRLHRSLFKHWDKLTEAEQDDIITVAKQEEWL